MVLDRTVIETANRQGGYITRRQLVRLGMSTSSIDRRIDRGELSVSTQGVYRVFRSDEHTDLLRGAVLALPGAVASHQSAAHLHELPYPPKLITTVTVHSRTTHLFPGVVVRRNTDLAKRHVVEVQGIPVTSIVRTVFDLAGILAFADIDRIAEALVVERRLKIRHLERMVDELARKGKRGASNARLIVESRGIHNKIDPTILERLGRSALNDANLPLPLPQYVIPWEPTRRFDDAYPTVRLAIEWDSRAWHTQKAAMALDRRRDREAAMHGWAVVRFTWTDVTENPREVADTVASLLRSRSRLATNLS